MRKIIFLLLFVPTQALAEANSDQYWQRLIARKEAQSAQDIVDLARALDAANLKIQELTKQIEAAKPKPEKNP